MIGPRCYEKDGGCGSIAKVVGVFKDGWEPKTNKDIIMLVCQCPICYRVFKEELTD